MSEWEEISLSEVVSHQKGFAFKSEDYQKAGIPVVRVSNFTSDSVDVSDLYFVSEDMGNENKNVELRMDDIVIATVGSWPSNPASIVGKTIRVPQSANGTLLNQNAVRLRVKDSNPDDQIFLYYVLKRPEFTNYLVSTAQGSANQASITLKDIFNYHFEWPEKKERKVIGEFLNAIDKKIELNRQINQTLEQIVRAIFKSWFVDFEPVKAKIAAKQNGQDPDRAAMRTISGKTDQLDQLSPDQRQQFTTTAALFPDELVDSELGKIPKGWALSIIGDEVDVVGGGTPSTKNGKFWEGGEISWATPKDLSGLQEKILLQTEKKITEKGLVKISSGLLPVDTVLMSSRAPVGYLAQTKIPVAINQGYIAMKCNGRLPPEYVLLWADSVMDEIKQRATGSTFAEISKKSFRPISIIVPNDNILSEFEKQSKIIFTKIAESTSESMILSEIRNSLLPKLLSGEISLNDPQPSFKAIAC
ncbi:restriction endonuclease subunit S [Nitrosomonas sp. Nm166]|uniref:restriction endonuclease subunit S n=1 Tax=Nitrosomonas sp. Nm166 TaxID=1881054 RepID=UPI0008EF8E9F|nr:restriction endonuclease subunit S [Nitrosomonas sp. Nm166]SFE57584.1 type I restriction enzyme, S subunit [Nitrosomonas sp. Nm166]